MRSKERGTRTSSFGVSKRESHDSSQFYSRKLYDKSVVEDKTAKESAIPEGVLDKVICADSRKLSLIPDESVHLMVTSPPYNVGKEYDQDLDLEEYRQLLRAVCQEVYSKLVVGGRACINVANLGRRPYIPLHSFIINDMLDIGYLMRGEVIWDKAASAGSSTAWGSWMSASNPVMRDVHEYLLIFSKGTMGRPSEGRTSTIAKEEFLEYTKSVWTFPAESATRVGHPAPFPVELPYRLIQLYTFEGDVVLDPFCGSGTTCIAAIRSNRHYVGFDKNDEYVELARSRIDEYVKGS
ncbi:MAG: site-specific DNA-methyltransferase [Candidatus Bathyarchaeota archaeon]|nr:MAG: site-specific DNA-methyltransferase [Candidatus Bathyarchaeota archaeon]